MADAPVAAPAASAPAPAAQPAAPAGATASPLASLKPHHSATQPRTEVGQFTAPGKEAPAEPQFVELDGRRVPVDEVRALYSQRQEDARAEQAAREELERLRAESRRWARPHEALTPQQRKEIAALELRALMEQEEEAKLPPEQRALRQQQRAFLQQKAEFERQQQERQQQEADAVTQYENRVAAQRVQQALKILEVDERDSFMLKAVVDEFYAAARAGRNYPPEVIAHRVRQKVDALATTRAAKLGPKALLGNADFVAALNNLDDADLLKALQPLGDRLRSLNLQSRGLTLVPGGQPPAQQGAPPVALAPGQEPRTTQEWVAFFRQGGKPAPSGPSHKAYWDLKDRGLL